MHTWSILDMRMYMYVGTPESYYINMSHVYFPFGSWELVNWWVRFQVAWFSTWSSWRWTTAWSSLRPTLWAEKCQEPKVMVTGWHVREPNKRLHAHTHTHRKSVNIYLFIYHTCVEWKCVSGNLDTHTNTNTNRDVHTHAQINVYIDTEWAWPCLKPWGDTQFYGHSKKGKDLIPNSGMETGSIFWDAPKWIEHILNLSRISRNLGTSECVEKLDAWKLRGKDRLQHPGKIWKGSIYPGCWSGNGSKKVKVSGDTFNT